MSSGALIDCLCLTLYGGICFLSRCSSLSSSVAALPYCMLPICAGQAAINGE